MDFCIPGQFDSAVDITSNTVNWRDFLRTPVESERIVDDPYPAKFKSEHRPKTPYTPVKVHQDGDVKQHLHGVFSSIIDSDKESIFVVTENTHNPNALFLIDPIICHEDKSRHQPVLVERHFSAEFSALVKGTVYYISMKTPIASKLTLEASGENMLSKVFDVFQRLEHDFPLVKLAVDNDSSNSHFYCYMTVDFPVFVESGHLSMLSTEEIGMAFEQLTFFADALERMVFLGGSRDLKKEELKIFNKLEIVNHAVKPCDSNHNADNTREKWQVLPSRNGKIAQLERVFEGRKFFKAVSVKKIDVDNTILPLLQLNSEYPFLRFLPKGKDFTALLNYPEIDFQLDEQLLLEKWFGYCCDKIEVV